MADRCPDFSLLRNLEFPTEGCPTSYISDIGCRGWVPTFYHIFALFIYLKFSDISPLSIILGCGCSS
jgi:hypothetical protein